MSNELAKEFLEGLFESKNIEEWQAKLKQSPEVKEWAIKSFNKAKESNDVNSK